MDCSHYYCIKAHISIVLQNILDKMHKENHALWHSYQLLLAKIYYFSF